MNMYRHILYIIVYNYILVSPGLLRASTFFSFFGSCFSKFRNALGNEITAKLVFIFKCMRLSS